MQLDADLTAYYDVKPQIEKIGAWDFATYDLPVDSVMRAAVASSTERALWACAESTIVSRILRQIVIFLMIEDEIWDKVNP